MTQKTEPQRLRQLRDALLTGLVERDLSVRLALIASLAGEHLLMVGPPGTAKSLIARRLHLAFAQSSYFERLLTRFTVPEELFGPLSIKGLEDDKYERLTDSYLPTASIAFLDEIFKANSAILNSLLTLLNEREFDNGTRRDKTPLIAVIGASNELPDNEELDALFDRFLLRLHVGPVSKKGFPALIGLAGHESPVLPEEIKLTSADLQEIQDCSAQVSVPDFVVALLCELRDWCGAESIYVSDRRWRKIVKLLQVSAWTNDRDVVSIWDCWLLQHCLWNKTEDREKIYEWYASRVGASAAMDPSRLTRLVVAWEGQLKVDQSSRSQRRDKDGNLLFQGSDGKPTLETTGNILMKRGNEPLYLAPADAINRNSRKRITDRTNSGKGYTVNELDEMQLDNQNYHNYVNFYAWDKRDLYFRNDSNWLMKNHEFPALMEPTRQKKSYIDNQLNQIDALKGDIVKYQGQLDGHIKGLETEIASHLWVMPEFAVPAAQNLKKTKVDIQALLARVDRVREGFEMLPIENDLLQDEDGHDETDAVAGL